jgi:hypothetical protein
VRVRQAVTQAGEDFGLPLGQGANQALRGPSGAWLNGRTGKMLAAWGAAGTLVAIWRYRWTPRPQ